MNTIDAMKEVLENNKEYKINYNGKEYKIYKNYREVVIDSIESEGEGLLLESVVVLQLEGWEVL